MIEKFTYPNFDSDEFSNAREISFKEVEKDGVAPDNFYLTTHLPTFYLYKGKWIIPEHNSLNCTPVLEGDEIIIKEIRDLQIGDKVITGRKTDGSEGIYVYRNGFGQGTYSGYRFAESSYSVDYDDLYKLLEHERKNGFITWVLGPSVVFDHDTRIALENLAENGYIHCLLGGNAIATHDLEGGYLDTALGQNIYTQENTPDGHYNHLDLLNQVRRAGSVSEFIDTGQVKNGIIKTLVEKDIPFVLSGSIRDDGPLPDVYSNVSEALEETKKYLNKSTLIIGLATLLHNLSVANLSSSYRILENGEIRPVYMYGVDLTENVLNKIGAARENIFYRGIATNVQDFVVNLERYLLKDLDGREKIDD